MSHVQKTIMKRLKAETNDLHSHAESRALQRAIASGEVERDAFAAYLGQLFLVHTALEGALEDSHGQHAAMTAVATADRMRVPDLIEDLKYWRVDPEGIEASDATRRFAAEIEKTRGSDAVALLGALYVLEGSTNGGRFLARALRRSWGLEDQGLSYFDPYGDEQPHRWADFKRGMDDASFEPRQEDAMVEMARTTFLAIAEVSDEVWRRIAARYPSPPPEPGN
jgi:heme oxygenase